MSTSKEIGNSHVSETDSQKTPKRAWAILAVTYFASAMAPMAQFKIPPLASWLFPAYHMDAVTFSYLMSTMAIIGVILAFPAAFIVRRVGLKATVLLSVACIAVGSAIGAITDSLGVLMASRMVEGVGIGLIGVAAPTCVSIWFPDKTRGLALGIWATWVPLGIVTMFNIAPAIASASGYQTVFWMVTVLSVLAFALFAIVFKVPEGKTGDMGIEGTFGQSMKLLKNKHIWVLGAVFFIFSFCTLGITNTFYNTFLETQLGFDAQLSSTLTSIMMLISLVSAPASGLLFDRLSLGHKRFGVVAMLIFILASVFVMFATGPSAIAFMWICIVIQGIAGGMGGGACRPMAPLLMNGTAMGATMGMAVLQFCQNLGSCLGSPIYAGMMQGMGWTGASMVLQIPLLIAGIVLAAFLNPLKAKADLSQK